jgi:hypothetical protein
MVSITNIGLEYLARYVGQQTSGHFGWLGLDGGTTVEAVGTTALTSEITAADALRTVATPTYETNTAVWQVNWSFTTSHSIYGFGLFDQLAVGGHLLMVHLFSAVKNVVNGDSMQLTAKLVYAR